MNEVRDWIRRLRELSSQQQDRGLTIRMRRVSAPSDVDFDDRIIRSENTDVLHQSFGYFPTHLSILQWPEVVSDPPDFLQEQSLASQFGSILTLVSGRRVHVASSEQVMEMKGAPGAKSFLPTPLADRSIHGPLPDTISEDFEATLRYLGGLSDRDAEIIGAAAELHYAAVLLCDIETNAAYTLAVGAVERLSRAFGSVSTDWTAWEQAQRFDNMFTEIGLSEAQAERIREELLSDRSIKLRQAFADYVLNSLSDDFWTAEIEDFHPSLRMDNAGVTTFQGMIRGDPIAVANIVPRDQVVLRSRLLKSYDRRSAYVHAGSKFPMSADLSSRVNPNPESSRPLSFLAVRAILSRLILRELKERSVPIELPDVRIAAPRADDV